MQTRRVWVAVHHHRHGVSVFAFDFEPTEEQVIAVINEDGGGYKPEREEYVEIESSMVLTADDLQDRVQKQADTVSESEEV